MADMAMLSVQGLGLEVSATCTWTFSGAFQVSAGARLAP